MSRALALVTVVVEDYDAAIAWYTGALGFFLHTGDFAADHAAMVARGVRFLEAPRHESYGMVAVFEDCCGNRWDLLEPRA